MKAIILTYAPVAKSEQEILRKTTIYKLALNRHAEEFCPDARILTDYILESVYKNFPNQKIISVRDTLRQNSDRIEYPNIKFKGSTILAAIDYLVFKNYDEILIIGDNKVNHTKFRDDVNYEIEKIPKYIKLYQYSNGNFKLPVQTIRDFCKN